GVFMGELALTLAVLAASPSPEPAPVEEPGPRNYFAAVLEAEGLHLAMLAFNNLATHGKFAAISWSSIASHFDGRQPWQWDDDLFLTNQFGHPYQGALTFTAARSLGLSFGW